MVRIDLDDGEKKLRDRIVRTHVVGRVLVVTMDRPERRNALGRVMRQGLRDAFDAFEADTRLRCAILTGTGAAFSAGGDLKEMADTAMRVPPLDSDYMLGSDGKVSKPVIAAVNGYAFAGGFRLVQNADLAVAAITATFAITEVHRGRGAPWAAPLIHQVPKKVMAELLFTGDAISAERALQYGFVNRVVSDDQLLPATMQLAERIAEGAPLSIDAAKSLIEFSAEYGVTHAEREADRVYERVYHSADAQEGMRAFLEKRPPRWRGE